MRARATLAAVLLTVCVACAPIPLARESPFHPSDAALAVTRVVHGSLVLELAGTRLLVDPWFHSGFFTRQGEPLGLTPATLPALGALLLTGDEPDRFDPRALTELAATVPRIIAPPALREQLVGMGFKDVTGLAWWEPTMVDGLTVTAVPSGNGPRANGYVVVSPDARAYVAGSTMAFSGLVDIAVAFPRLDIAILPIGGRRVLGVLHEMTPAQAADAAQTLDAARVIPTGYGARSRSPFTWYGGDALDEFRNAMAAKGLADRVLVLDTGESWHYSRGGGQP
jgi:L-ascorbate metabolism protein UlaG (beta-lactamase superfamily)